MKKNWWNFTTPLSCTVQYLLSLEYGLLSYHGIEFCAKKGRICLHHLGVINLGGGGGQQYLVNLPSSQPNTTWRESAAPVFTPLKGEQMTLAQLWWGDNRVLYALAQSWIFRMHHEGWRLKSTSVFPISFNAFRYYYEKSHSSLRRTNFDKVNKSHCPMSTIADTECGPDLQLTTLHWAVSAPPPPLVPLHE